jgi:hypothetical protein
MSATVAAQGQSAPDPQLERNRNEVRVFEMVLVQAVESAGQKLAAWAGKLAPNVILSTAADPVVNGIPSPEGLMFVVRLSELSGVAVFNRYPPFLQSSPTVVAPPETGPVKPVAQTEGRVTSTTVVPDDPMKSASPPDPNKEYSDLVRLGLMDALIDSSSVLTLRDGQWLTVAAIPVDVLVTNPMYRNTSRKLVLSIKGEDLAAFRAGKITRDEAKQRIIETRF